MLRLRPCRIKGEHLDFAVTMGESFGNGDKKSARARASMLPAKGSRRATLGRCSQDIGSESARRTQGDHLGSLAACLGELSREVKDPSNLCTSKGIDRLVWITHHNEIAPVTGHS